MSIKPVEFKLARSAEEIAERINQLQQDYRAGLLATGRARWLNYIYECLTRLRVLHSKLTPDRIDSEYRPEENDDVALYGCLRYAALAESMWLYGLKDSVHVPLPGTNYSTESYR